MPTLKDSTNADTPVFDEALPRPSPPTLKYVPEGSLLPSYNPSLRCPLPPSFSTPDSQRNFYIGSKIPQMRIARPNDTNSGSSTFTENVKTISNTTSVATTEFVTQLINDLTIQSDQIAAATSSVLSVGDQWQGTVLMAKLVAIKIMSVTSPARVRVYSTLSQQNTDSGRGDSTAELNGTSHGVIVDMWLDNTQPFILSPVALGGNCDVPDSTTLYITIDNIGDSTTAITASFTYVGEES